MLPPDDETIVVDAARLKLLFHGDSISDGQRQHLIPASESEAYAHYYTHFVGHIGPKLNVVVEKSLAAADLKVIFLMVLFTRPHGSLNPNSEIGL